MCGAADNMVKQVDAIAIVSTAPVIIIHKKMSTYQVFDILTAASLREEVLDYGFLPSPSCSEGWSPLALLKEEQHMYITL